MFSERNCSNCVLQVPDGYFTCFRCGQKQPSGSPLLFGPRSAHNRHKPLIKWTAIGAVGVIVLAIIYAVPGPSDEQSTLEFPQLAPAADSAGSEVDGVAFADRIIVSPPVVAPTVSAQGLRPTISPTVKPDARFIRLIDPLDEPEYYCVDVPRAGRGVRLESALQAHTCKPIETAADELFTINHPNDGQIYMEAYDLCVEADGMHKGSALPLKACSETRSQLFIFAGNSIRLSIDRQDDLCLAVAPGEGLPTGAPSHLRRALSLESCRSIGATLTGWTPILTYTRYCYEYDGSNNTKYTCGEWPE